MTMKKLLFSVFILTSVSLFAQTTIETKLVVTTNAGTNGGLFKVAIQAKGTNLTANNTLGSATIDVYFTAADIAPVIVGGTIVQGIYDATIGSNYNPSLSYVAGGPYVRLSLSGGNINSNGNGTPEGLDLTPSYHTLATINFTILNSAVSTNLTIDTGSLTVGLFSTHNNEDFSGTINPQTMSAPVNIASEPLPVELSSFTASSNQNGVNLKWQTETEVNNYGFDVERKVHTSTEFSPIKSGLSVTVWEKVGFVAGNGNSNSPKEYSFIDKSPSGGSKFQYRLKQIDNDGAFEYSDVVNVNVGTPEEYYLSHNYPNPFNPATTIDYMISNDEKVNLKVYDILGTEVATLVDEYKQAGSYSVTFNADNLSSGIYIYRLIAGEYISVNRMSLIK
jgi:hypothetical protein